VDFLVVLIELFSLAVTAETLRAKIDWKSAYGWVSIRQIFTYRGNPTNQFCRDR